MPICRSPGIATTTWPIPWWPAQSFANPLAYNILYKKSVERDLKKLPKTVISNLLDQIEQKLAHQPETYPRLKGSFQGLLRLRVGEYRVIFTVFGQDVHVLRIAHRKDAYREADWFRSTRSPARERPCFIFPDGNERGGTELSIPSSRDRWREWLNWKIALCLVSSKEDLNEARAVLGENQHLLTFADANEAQCWAQAHLPAGKWDILKVRLHLTR
jgi:mRNA interferase RelE/StbE